MTDKILETCMFRNVCQPTNYSQTPNLYAYDSQVLAYFALIKSWILSKDVVLAVQYSKYGKLTQLNKSTHWPTQCCTAKGMGLHKVVLRNQQLPTGPHQKTMSIFLDVENLAPNISITFFPKLKHFKNIVRWPEPQMTKFS